MRSTVQEGYIIYSPVTTSIHYTDLACRSIDTAFISDASSEEGAMQQPISAIYDKPGVPPISCVHIVGSDVVAFHAARARSAVI